MDILLELLPCLLVVHEAERALRSKAVQNINPAIPVEQLQSFLKEAKATGSYEMYCIELAARLRRGKLPGLKWQDIDRKNGTMKVRQ